MKKNKYKNIINDNPIPSGIILILGGLFLGIFGYFFRKICISLVCVAGFAYLYYILDGLFNLYSEYTTIAIIMICVFLATSILIAIVFTLKQQYFRIYMFIIGGLVGFLIGWLINHFLIIRIDTSNLKIVQYVIYGVLTLIGLVLCFFLPKYIYIFGTSFVGAYGIVRGISLLLSSKIKIMDEQKLFDLARTGNFESIENSIDNLFYIYPAILIVLTIIMIIIQNRINPNFNDIEEYWKLNQNYGNIDYPNNNLGFEQENEEIQQIKEDE